jgi:hypothetical protein
LHSALDEQKSVTTVAPLEKRKRFAKADAANGESDEGQSEAFIMLFREISFFPHFQLRQVRTNLNGHVEGLDQSSRKSSRWQEVRIMDAMRQMDPAKASDHITVAQPHHACRAQPFEVRGMGVNIPFGSHKTAFFRPVRRSGY